MEMVSPFARILYLSECVMYQIREVDSVSLIRITYIDMRDCQGVRDPFQNSLFRLVARLHAAGQPVRIVTDATIRQKWYVPKVSHKYYGERQEATGRQSGLERDFETIMHGGL